MKLVSEDTENHFFGLVTAFLKMWFVKNTKQQQKDANKPEER